MKRMSIVLAAVALAAGIAAPSLLAAVDVALRNWPVPTSQRGGARTQGTLGTLTDVRSPGTFVPMVPCRVVDTRGPIGTFGGPIMTGGAPARTFPITSGPCTGIAANPSAYSLNFTVVDMVPGDGFLTAFPTGTSQPVVSTLDYKQIVGFIANAAIVPAGSGNSINVFVNVTTNLIIDINGYFIDSFSLINPGEFYGFAGAGTGVLGLVFSSNSNTSTAAQVSAFRGLMTGAGNGGAAILGEQTTASGANFGARGNNSSATSQSAGVLGVSGSRTTISDTFFPSGVRGESTGSRNGVLGTIQDSGGGFAVAGFTYSGTPAQVRVGRLGDAGSGLGVSYVGGLGGSGAKAFYEPHPTDPDKVIRYVSLEGPEAGTYFRGRGVLENGRAVIDVPESFRMVTDADGLTAQVTVMGRPTTIGVSSLDLNQVVVEGTRDVEFSYLVQGVRRAYKDFQVVAKNAFFQPRSPGDQMPSSLSPDEKARLVANGTYNADGSVNMGTAERLGWAQQWRDRDRLEQERAAAEVAERAGKPPNQP